MNLASETHRYEDQFFQFDQTLYQNRYSTSSRDHSITENAEPDYGNDLVNEKFDNENIGNEQTDNDEFNNEEFDNEGLEDLDENDEAGTDPDRNI
ncbi:hypothetical protein EV144_101383 [Flavobacterium sp. 270]|uniref:hypothetical protein n=1 Tax=Flavobacterium sp. 270 TaxID=2512114 RepID=UPI001066A264|nr:hypothetical protein [Flavobacterium sp. 270]TDW51707.1 hypothetical protein EV144_101383 [Flavobacterium sp. 270]